MTKKDQVLLAQLVDRYSPAIIATEAAKVSPNPTTPGRKPDYLYNLASVWGFVEYWSEPLSGGTRGGVSRACQKLEDILRGVTPERKYHLNHVTLRGMYYRAQNLRDGNQHLAELMTGALRSYQDAAGAGVPIFMRVANGELRGMIIDTWALKDILRPKTK